MALKRVYVEISHLFKIDIPDALLVEGNEEILDEYLYEAFIDEHWAFDELSITDA